MFYTYMWLREDGTPYYVGKGVGKRAYVEHYRRGNVTLYPPPIGRMVFYIAKDEDESFENEVALIWYYGRKDLGTGCLRNMSNGGEKPPRPTQEAHRKASLSMTGRKQPAISARMLGKKYALGHVLSTEAKAAIGARKKGNTYASGKRSAEFIAKMKIASKGNTNALGKKRTEESKAKMRAAKLGKPWSLARRKAQQSE